MAVPENKHADVYRARMGITNKQKYQKRIKFTDIPYEISETRIIAMIDSLKVQIWNFNLGLKPSLQLTWEEFEPRFKSLTYDTYYWLRDTDNLKRLNNDARHPEKVFEKWLVGNAFYIPMLKPLARIFKTTIDKIEFIGGDMDRVNFRKDSCADLELIACNQKKYRIEIQVGTNEAGAAHVKESKFIEARRVKDAEGMDTLLVHIDYFTHQIAFVYLNTYDAQRWEKAFENKDVTPIMSRNFRWKELWKVPPSLEKIKQNKEILDKSVTPELELKAD